MELREALEAVHAPFKQRVAGSSPLQLTISATDQEFAQFT
jgi:hypothetical protein